MDYLIKMIVENERLMMTDFVLQSPSLNRKLILYLTVVRNKNNISFRIHCDYTSAKLFINEVKRLAELKGGIVIN